MAKLQCPFNGCTYTNLRCELDSHTQTCPYGNVYSLVSQHILMLVSWNYMSFASRRSLC
jgi:hypothetical protein